MIGKVLTRALTSMVRGYQMVVSPWFAPTCRYYPSCSAYAIDALGEHGPIKGLYLSAWRLLRCNPWSKGGVDPVPTTHMSRNIGRARGGEAPAPPARTPDSPTTDRAGDNPAVSASSPRSTLHGNL